jgi:hypothetical protein
MEILPLDSKGDFLEYIFTTNVNRTVDGRKPLTPRNGEREEIYAMSHLRLKSVLVVLLMLATTSFAADADNPYKTAKVGDWAKYKQTMKGEGVEMEMEMKQTVTAKTDKEVTIEKEMSVAGQTTKETETIKLDEAYNPIKEMADGAKEVGKGDEKLTIAGKTYDTKWVEYETTIQGEGDATVKMKIKIWNCATVVGGMVKFVSDMGTHGNVSVELVDAGSGK